MRHFIFGVDGNGERFDGLAVRVLHNADALANAVLILLVAEIDRQHDRHADDGYHHRVMLKSNVHYRAGGADRQEENGRAEKTFQMAKHRLVVAQRDER